MASSSNAGPSSSLTSRQPSAPARFVPSLPYYLAAPAGRAIQPGRSAETGLPMDVWLHVLDILSGDHSSIALLACASTCRYLYWPAQRIINRLIWRRIRSWTYEDVDQIVAEIRTAPKDAKRITNITFETESGANDESQRSTVALSVVPLRMTGQRALTNLCNLEFGNVASREIEPHFHPHSYPLYGRALSNVSQIVLNQIQFPSFIDFAFFVTSFPALVSLTLRHVSCRNQVITLSVARGPKKRNLRLRSLRVEGHGERDEWFAAAFLQWFPRRCDEYPKKIEFSERLFHHAWGREVLRNSSGSLSELAVWLDTRARRSQGSVARHSWLGVWFLSLVVRNSLYCLC
ncbi:hypothetical protein NLI96_g7595 [Meripilus lineatus]|uniref:F-box domain-containing protein n=1 Tax=Meripilus lineatus TaxID=2056292 RepID=A0AAD5YCT2_9APHY|nr:hypothetical protein NLI96_g7595 [Physisporinus lineatus]